MNRERRAFPRSCDLLGASTAAAQFECHFFVCPPPPAQPLRNLSGIPFFFPSPLAQPLRNLSATVFVTSPKHAAAAHCRLGGLGPTGADWGRLGLLVGCGRIAASSVLDSLQTWGRLGRLDRLGRLVPFCRLGQLVRLVSLGRLGRLDSIGPIGVLSLLCGLRSEV